MGGAVGSNEWIKVAVDLSTWKGYTLSILVTSFVEAAWKGMGGLSNEVGQNAHYAGFKRNTTPEWYVDAAHTGGDCDIPNPGAGDPPLPHLLTLTFSDLNGGTMKFYINGQYINTNTASGDFRSVTHLHVLASPRSAANMEMQGIAAGVWLWNWEFPAAMIRTHNADPFCMLRPSRRLSMYIPGAAPGGTAARHLIQAYMRGR